MASGDTGRTAHFSSMDRGFDRTCRQPSYKVFAPHLHAANEHKAKG
jgi:hypothetical protein